MATTEREIQISIVQWAAWALKHVVVFHIPNGGARHPAVAAKLKQEGVMAGVADLCVLLPEGKIIWVEVKRPKGRQNKAQQKFQALCEEFGHTYHIVYSLAEFIELFRKK
jgi:hypothetical protein